MIKEPKILLHRFKIIFQLACFLFALYFTAHFSTQYSENSDTQLIRIRKFNQENKTNYPTFSFCFKGSRFHWLHDLYIFDSYGLNATQYERMLRGETSEKYERTDLYRSYKKTPVFSNNETEKVFRSFFVKLADFLYSLNFATERSYSDTKILHPNDWNTTKEPPMNLAFQTTDMICFSRMSNDALHSVRLSDLITINSSIIQYYNETEMEIFVHYPNQLIRSFSEPKYSASFSYLISILNDTTPKVLEIKLSESKRIKKRHDSKEPCNQTIENYDEYLKHKISEHMMEKIGCVPIYLKYHLSNHTEVTDCISAEDHKKAYKVMTNMKKILKRNQIPCDEMLVLAIDSINNKPSPVPEDIAIQFIYSAKIYEEIKYVNAMNFDNWLGNVGGFVGIFLGYSMMQFPEFLLLIATTFDTKRRNLWTGKKLF